MSIEALCDQDEVSVYSNVATTGASMGVEYAPTLVATKRCLVQELSAGERNQYAARSMQVTHQIFFAADPSITIENTLAWGGRTLTIKGVMKEGRPGQSLLWIVLAEID